MIMKNYKYIFFTLIIFLFFSCIQSNKSERSERSERKIPSNIEYITNCDSLIVDSTFKANYSTNNLFKSKPNSIVESICLLDKNLNEYAKHYILVCDQGEFYFSIGLKIRNKWVRHGTSEFQRELYKDIQLQHVDYTSSFILEVYKYYLENDESKNLVDYLITEKNKNIDASIISKLLEIDKDLKNNLPCKCNP